MGFPELKQRYLSALLQEALGEVPHSCFWILPTFLDLWIPSSFKTKNSQVFLTLSHSDTSYSLFHLDTCDYIQPT